MTFVLVFLQCVDFINEIVIFFQAEDGIRDDLVTGVQTCALPIFVKDRIGLFVNDQDSVDKIKDNCNKMLENITEFKSSAQIICDRLQEGKIRIVSIGE